MLKPVWDQQWERTSRERRQGDHKTASLGRREEAEAPDKDMGDIISAEARS